MGKSEAHILSFSNFNPVALLSLILLCIGVILGAVSMGIGQWSRLDADRFDDSIMDGGTFKTLGLISRCVSYDFTRDILERQLTPEQQPQSGCLPVSSVNCTASSIPLISALDDLMHNELQNADSESNCKQMKVRIQVSAAFVILGIIAAFISGVFYFPFWHFGFYIAGAVLALASVIFYAIGIGVYLDQQQHFAGFFSLDGMPQSACLSYGFGIALTALIINVIATLVGSVAICYRKVFPPRHKRDKYTFRK